MIVLDTSVWIDCFRGRRSQVIQQTNEILDQGRVLLVAPVRAEILAGAARKTKEVLDRVLMALPVLYPVTETWMKVEKWIREGIDKGARFAVMDLLIAAIAADNDASLWSFDRDFNRMERLGWVKMFHPVAG